MVQVWWILSIQLCFFIGYFWTLANFIYFFRYNTFSVSYFILDLDWASRVYVSWLTSVIMCVDAVFAPTIFHMLCLTNTAIRRGPFVAVLWEWKGTQPWPWWTLTAWCLWLLQPAVIATLQWPLMWVLRLTHNRKRHSTKRLQKKRFWMSPKYQIVNDLITKHINHIYQGLLATHSIQNG